MRAHLVKFSVIFVGEIFCVFFSWAFVVSAKSIKRKPPCALELEWVTMPCILFMLLLGNPPEQSLPGLEENEALMPIAGPQQPNIEPLPDASSEANPPNPPGTAPRPGTLLGVAVKTDQVDNPTATEGQPDDADDNDDNQTDDKNGKKKTFVTKEYRLKIELKLKGNLNVVCVPQNWKVYVITTNTT